MAAEWVGAIGTWAAFIAALLLLWHEAKRYGELEEKRQEREERSQASQIHAWVEDEANGVGQGPHARIRVHNMSDGPAIQLRVEFCQPTQDGSIHSTSVWTKDVLGPGELHREVVPVDQQYIEAGATGTVIGAPLRLTFTDAHGIGWERWMPTGTLRSIGRVKTMAPIP